MARPPKYPVELRERAVRMVFEVRERTGGARGAMSSVAEKLNVPYEMLRVWVKTEDDRRRRDGDPGIDRARIAQLERENRELRRANEILKAAASFFGAELDRQSKK